MYHPAHYNHQGSQLPIGETKRGFWIMLDHAVLSLPMRIGLDKNGEEMTLLPVLSLPESETL